MAWEIKTVDYDLAFSTSNLACSIFIDYFKDIIGLDQATYMADKFLSLNAINLELAQNTIFKLFYLNNEAVGFSEYKIINDRIFLSKLYVHKDYRGQRIASFLLDDVVKYAKNLNKRAIFLTVNKHNLPTINIYKHWNFKIIDAVKTPIGNGYIMDDYIMEKTL